MSEYVPCGIGRKSTLLLLLIIFCLINAGLLFRAAVNTLYFMEDPTDYSAITGTVTDLVPEKESSGEVTGLLTPVFSFDYQGETMTREAPVLQYTPRETGSGPYQIGDEVSLWIHDYQGEIILPPAFSRKRVGVSQLVVSALSLILALVLWKIRNLLARKKRTCNLK